MITQKLNDIVPKPLKYALTNKYKKKITIKTIFLQKYFTVLPGFFL